MCACELSLMLVRVNKTNYEYSKLGSEKLSKFARVRVQMQYPQSSLQLSTTSPPPRRCRQDAYMSRWSTAVVHRMQKHVCSLCTTHAHFTPADEDRDKGPALPSREVAMAKAFGRGVASWHLHSD